MFMLLLFFCKANTYHGFTIKELQPSIYLYIFEFNRIGGVMASVLASSAVDRGFEPRRVFQTENGRQKLGEL
jgi:hypothetical protein